jgi:hypothetical protein
MQKYFEKYGKPRHAFEMIESELKAAKKALKKGEMPETDIATLKSASDSDFTVLYEEQVKGTFPNELAEAIVKIVDFADSYGFNLIDYVEVVSRYCALKSSPIPTTVTTTPVIPVTSKVVVRYL